MPRELDGIPISGDEPPRDGPEPTLCEWDYTTSRWVPVTPQHGTCPQCSADTSDIDPAETIEIPLWRWHVLTCHSTRLRAAADEIERLRAEVECVKADLAYERGKVSVYEAEIGRLRAERDDLDNFTAETFLARLAAAERVAECVKDLCWKATPFGHDDAGFITMYVLPAGTLHRLAGAAQGAGIAAHLRAEGDQVDGTAVSGREEHGV